MPALSWDSQGWSLPAGSSGFVSGSLGAEPLFSVPAWIWHSSRRALPRSAPGSIGGQG